MNGSYVQSRDILSRSVSAPASRSLLPNADEMEAGENGTRASGGGGRRTSDGRGPAGDAPEGKRRNLPHGVCRSRTSPSAFLCAPAMLRSGLALHGHLYPLPTVGGAESGPRLASPFGAVRVWRTRGPFSCREGAIGAETPSRGPGLSQGVTRASAPPSPPPCWDWDMSVPRREPREGSGHPSSLSGASLVCTVGRSRGRHWVTLS